MVNWDNKEEVIEAVKNDGYARYSIKNAYLLRYASEELRNDPKIRYIASVDWKKWNRIFNKMVVVNQFIKIFREVKYRPGNSGYIESLNSFEKLVI